MATLLVAAVSYRCVEQPIRKGLVDRYFAELRDSLTTKQLQLVAKGAVTTVIAFCILLTLTVLVLGAKPDMASQESSAYVSDPLPQVNVVHQTHECCLLRVLSSL